ncbi:type II secretion system major pseudopilin GspG [Lysobacter silvisoli]|uniref:Type II secretion system core protein G n=1 Tax=Lysobacter silvisoli TaxID=2293254 RepID=A0A371K0W4_9GAMM|nr:type II secretion system major pseudopilin GspG [Lysobacter silvisoli]RDZ27569.1 type II secretion system protein GspG [Lysobacter silvisoli]
MRNPRSLRRPSAALQRGMSLIEIIIVIVLIGLVATVVGTKVFGAGDQAKFKLAKSQVEALAIKVESFKDDTGRLPNSLDELIKAPSDASGWLGPYVKKESDLKDPWGHAVEYRVPGEGRDFDLIVLGKDGKVGGTSVDGDIKYE